MGPRAVVRLEASGKSSSWLVLDSNGGKSPSPSLLSKAPIVPDLVTLTELLTSALVSLSRPL